MSDDDPEVTLSTKELAELIRQLPPGYQAIFNLHAVEGYSHVEIGKILGIKEGTSRSQYARARSLLISWINRYATANKNELPMYDPKFEKAVRQKMEELEFRPAESVWVGVERAVSRQRRRRVPPFFWQLFLPMVLVAGAAAGYYFGEKAGRKSVAPAVVQAGASRVVRDAGSEGSKTSPPGDVLVKAGRQHTPRTGVVQTPDPVVGEQGGADEAATGSRIGAYLYTPGLEDQRHSAGVSGAALKANKNLVRLNTLSQVKRPLEAGFAAGVGMDRLNRLDANQANAAVSYSAVSLYTLNGSTSSKNYISDIRPDASFYAGIYLQKGLSERWIFNAGLNLHYYSTRISVGQPVNTFVPAYASLITPTSIATSQVSSVFTVGNEQIHTNKYYMLELPAAIQYKLNRSRILPLFLEGGVSLSRLMGADALNYDPSKGLYFKNTNALNKTQFNVSSALMVGLPFHGIRIQAGPQVQYGLIPLMNTQGMGDQHFFYTGIRLVVLPGKR